MAESVDATVSNTVGATHPGSSPGPGTQKSLQLSKLQGFNFWGKAQAKHKKDCLAGDGVSG